MKQIDGLLFDIVGIVVERPADLAIDIDHGVVAEVGVPVGSIRAQRVQVLQPEQLELIDELVGHDQIGQAVVNAHLVVAHWWHLTTLGHIEHLVGTQTSVKALRLGTANFPEFLLPEVSRLFGVDVELLVELIVHEYAEPEQKAHVHAFDERTQVDQGHVVDARLQVLFFVTQSVVDHSPGYY
ncbi:unnamed protein product [Sphagnum jensenii]|uniref:Uncharacterized protein n=1 Tax=Sphagnum jensenii TaxID=128206 RepID=A0ABP0VDZ5_9BRYO